MNGSLFYFKHMSLNNLHNFKGTSFNEHDTALCIRIHLAWVLLPVSVLRSEETRV